MRFNKLWVGFVAGLSLPVLALVIFFTYSFKTLSISDFFMMIQKMDILTQTLTFCILPSFLSFFVFYWKQYNKAAQGVVLSTMLLTITLVIINF